MILYLPYKHDIQANREYGPKKNSVVEKRIDLPQRLQNIACQYIPQAHLSIWARLGHVLRGRPLTPSRGVWCGGEDDCRARERGEVVAEEKADIG